jgi:hypothetical protein
MRTGMELLINLHAMAEPICDFIISVETNPSCQEQTTFNGDCYSKAIFNQKQHFSLQFIISHGESCL